MVYLGEVGLEQKRDALARVRQQARGCHDDKQQDKQGRHEDIAHLLNAFANTTHHDEVREDNEDDGPYKRLYGRGGELLEIFLHISGIAVDVTHDRGEEILQTPARNDGIETEDDERCEGSDEPHGSPCLAASRPSISPCGIGGTVATYDKLGDHAGDAEHEDTGQIDHDECGATVVSRHVRKAPNVTQPHR